MASLQLKLLGGFNACTASEQAVEISGKKNQALLAYLALNSGKNISREKLVGVLWSDRGDAQARSSLRQALVALRRDLAEVDPGILIVEGDTVAIAPSAVLTDVTEFERLSASIVGDDLRQAAALYEGDFMDGTAVRDPAYDEWLSIERGRLREIAISTLTRLSGQQSGGEAVATAKRLITLDPLREASHRALMEIHAAQGHRDQAIRQYQTCRDILWRELSMEPSPETEALHRLVSEGRYGQAGRDKLPAAVQEGAPLPAKQPAPALTDRPSIAVLPFQNMSADPEQEYFSDGITEDIITELSRFRSLFVIARNSSFVYKGRAANVIEIGRILGVRYVAEGSVRRANNRVRVTAQLVDTQTGSHLWAERFDREFDDIFAVQDEVARRIVTTIEPLLAAESLQLAKRTPPEDMQAYDCYLRAKSLVDLARTAADLKEGRKLCDRAIEIEPTFARAYAYKALSYTVGIFTMESADVSEWRKRALLSAEQAVALDAMDSVCHWALSEAAFHLKQYDRCRTHIARAVSLNPNDADILVMSGWIQVTCGDPRLGMLHMEMALERSPSHPPGYDWVRGIMLNMVGQYDEALAAFDLYGQPNADILKWRVVTLVQLGRIDEARASVRALLLLKPDLTVSEAKRLFDYLPTNESHLVALRRAGLPE